MSLKREAYESLSMMAHSENQDLALEFLRRILDVSEAVLAAYQDGDPDRAHEIAEAATGYALLQSALPEWEQPEAQTIIDEATKPDYLASGGPLPPCEACDNTDGAFVIDPARCRQCMGL